MRYPRYLLPVLWGMVLGGLPVQANDLNDVLARLRIDWMTRQTQFESGRVRWAQTEDRTIPADRTSGETAAVRLVGSKPLRSVHLLAFNQEGYRLQREGEMWDARRKEVVEQSELLCYDTFVTWSKRATASGAVRGIVGRRLGETDWSTGIDNVLEPLVTAYRPMTAALSPLRAVEGLGHGIEVSRDPMTSLLKLSYQLFSVGHVLWIDESRLHAVVRHEMVVDGRPWSRLETEFDGLSPRSWALYRYGQMRSSEICLYSVRVLECELNSPVETASFHPQFEPEMAVEESCVTMPYYVRREDGSLRQCVPGEVSAAESPYLLAMSPSIKEQAEQQHRWWGTVTAASVCAVGLVIMVTRKGKLLPG